MIWQRLTALFVGLAFVLATTEAFGHHHCPVHDGIVSDMDAMPGMHGMPDHQAPGHSHTPEHSQDPAHSHGCTCLGACCCAVAVTAPSDRLVALPVVPVTIVRIAAVARSADAWPKSREDVLLPPPIGPPELLPV
jgi:hypothetical protein